MQVCTMTQTVPGSHHSVFYRPDALPDAQSIASALKAQALKLLFSIHNNKCHVTMKQFLLTVKIHVQNKVTWTNESFATNTELLTFITWTHQFSLNIHTDKMHYQTLISSVINKKLFRRCELFATKTVSVQNDSAHVLSELWLQQQHLAQSVHLHLRTCEEKHLWHSQHNNAFSLS